jgi:glycosyltransferase involved in cell wall biosynthesis
VVASDIGGTREAVIDGVTGFLCPPDAVEDYVERIVQLASSPELRAAMGAAPRQRYERQFTLEAMAAEMEALYHRAMV